MPNSLLDMFQPQDAAGQPASLGDAFTSRSNSLIGLGLGLLAPSNPLRGQSSWGQALEGFQGGAQIDARTAAAAAQLKQHRADQARAQANADRAFAEGKSHWEQQFAENKLTDAEKLARASGIAPGTPEHQAFIQRAIQSKTEGDWKIAEVPHPLYPDQKIPVWANARTRETMPFTGGPPPATTAVGGGPDAPLAGGGVSYGEAGVGNQGFGTGGVAPVYPAGTPTAAAPSGGAAAVPVPGRAFPPPQPGMNSKVYAEEMTKRAVKDQAEQERVKKQAGMIDPIKEDIGQAIKIIEASPKSTTGVYGSLASHFGGQAGDLSGLLESVKASVSFDKLNQMRQASPTGGALGNVSDKDMKALQSVMGSLEQSRTPEQLKYNLDRIDRIRHEIIHGPGTAPPPRFAPPDPSGASARKTAQPKIKPGFVDPDFPDQVFKGGDPASPDSWVKKR